MFAYIKGTLEYKTNDSIVVDANGIGYKIFTALSTIDNVGAIGNTVKIHTHLHVREDIMSLYGFVTLEELTMFEMLLNISGVGPKAANSIISTLTPSKFGLAIITDDTKSLSKAPGIGSKMAQRIILELKDKIKKEQLTDINSSKSTNAQQDNSSKLGESISALMVLGYSVVEANMAVAKVYSEEMELEAIIKGALKSLAR